MKRPEEFPVLIVGAGPAGLTSAATLAAAGVRSLLVERRLEPSKLPRATTISLRSMEIFRSWGLEPAIRAGGNDVEWVLWRCDTLARVDEGYGVAVGIPTASQAALVSPTSPACAPQDHLERVLSDHVARAGATEVARGTELVDVDVRRDGVLATLRDIATGEERVVQARYLVVADGAHSRTRKALGIAMHGPAHLVDGVAVLLRAPLWPLLREHRYGLFGIMPPEASAVFLPAGPGDRWGWGGLHEPGKPVPSEQEVERRIRLGIGDAVMPLRIERVGTFSAGAQVAERLRHESAFLIGDAAHRVTPRGGTGMNTAIHDGHDLGWKLAWVLHGWAGDGLLDSYETERRPVAEHNVARSADPDGSARGVEDELRADLAGRVAHLWVAGPDGRRSTLDLLGPGLTLFTGPDPSPAVLASAEAERAPVAVREVDELTARALGIRRGGGLMVRPDGTPAAWWPHAARAAA